MRFLVDSVTFSKLQRLLSHVLRGKSSGIFSFLIRVGRASSFRTYFSDQNDCGDHQLYFAPAVSGSTAYVRIICPSLLVVGQDYVTSQLDISAVSLLGRPFNCPPELFLPSMEASSIQINVLYQSGVPSQLVIYMQHKCEVQFKSLRFLSF